MTRDGDSKTKVWWLWTFRFWTVHRFLCFFNIWTKPYGDTLYFFAAWPCLLVYHEGGYLALKEKKEEHNGWCTVPSRTWNKNINIDIPRSPYSPNGHDPITEPFTIACTDRADYHNDVRFLRFRSPKKGCWRKWHPGERVLLACMRSFNIMHSMLTRTGVVPTNWFQDLASRLVFRASRKQHWPKSIRILHRHPYKKNFLMWCMRLINCQWHFYLFCHFSRKVLLFPSPVRSPFSLRHEGSLLQPNPKPQCRDFVRR